MDRARAAVSHQRIDNAADASRRCDHVTVEQRVGNLLFDSTCRGVITQGHAAAEEAIRRDMAEDKVRIGDGRLLAPKAITGWPRIGRCAHRTYPKPPIVDPSDRAAAGADRHHVDHWQTELILIEDRLLGV